MNKSIEIETRMREMIRSGMWAPNSRIPTEDDLCTQFGVSRTTVRTALSALRSEGRILSRPRAGTVIAPRALRRTVHLVEGNSGANMIDAAYIYHMVRFGAAHTEWEFKIHECGRDARRESALVKEFLSDPDAWVLLTGLYSDKTRKLISENPGRVAILGMAPELFGVCPQVQTDIRAGAEMMMDYLLSMGHRRIAYLGGYADGARFQAWKERLTLAGYPPDEGASVVVEDESDVNIAARVRVASRFLRRILADGKPVSAVYCMSDTWALSLLHAVYAAGLEVPADLSIAGFDGAISELDSPENVSITTVVQPFERIFASALNALENFHGEGPRILIKPQLFIGTSVAGIHHN